MSASNGNGDEKKPTPDPKQVKAAQEERRRNWLLAGVFIVGALCVLPFTVALFRLLDICGTHTAQLSFYAVALNSALAIAFGGILLCVLLLFYRLRNEETSPSLTSGVIVGRCRVAARGHPVRGSWAYLRPIRSARRHAPSVLCGVGATALLVGEVDRWQQGSIRSAQARPSPPKGSRRKRAVLAGFGPDRRAV